MKPIGWMILISDTLHGFIEGITIGAIAMVSIGECIRMMVAIACEEFSHKLGKISHSIHLPSIFFALQVMLPYC